MHRTLEDIIKLLALLEALAYITPELSLIVLPALSGVDKLTKSDLDRIARRRRELARRIALALGFLEVGEVTSNAVYYTVGPEGRWLRELYEKLLSDPELERLYRAYRKIYCAQLISAVRAYLAEKKNKDRRSASKLA